MVGEKRCLEVMPSRRRTGGTGIPTQPWKRVPEGRIPGRGPGWWNPWSSVAVAVTLVT